MTEPEIAEYLGLPRDAKLRPEIVEGMAEVNIPVTDHDHIAAFLAFLKCVGPPGHGAIDSCK